MASNTKNVKMGVCRLFFGGVDLGFTQGGVEVNVTTETHQTMVDQFGKTPINDSIMGRDVKVKAPLAETTLENFLLVVPGSTMVTDGVRAVGTLTFAANPTAAQTVVVNGVTVTFKAAPTVGADEVKLGATKEDTVKNLQIFLDNSTNAALVVADYKAAAAVLTVTYDTEGTAGNAFTLAAGTSGATASAGTLSGGTAATKKYVKVATGIGINLLDIAKELRIHPKGKADNDRSDDFVIPLAATPGALSFAYKLENERIFSCEFQGYPDSVTDILFIVGDDS
jgi:hypothetical protein